VIILESNPDELYFEIDVKLTTLLVEKRLIDAKDGANVIGEEVFTLRLFN
jgi:hypothetical protein